MHTLIVATGARGAGKSYSASHLAKAIPGAVVIEEHAYGISEGDPLYDARCHIHDPWRRNKGGVPVGFRSVAIEGQIRAAAVAILCSGVEDVDAKIALLQQLAPCSVVYVTSTLRRDVPHGSAALLAQAR